MLIAPKCSEVNCFLLFMLVSCFMLFMYDTKAEALTFEQVRSLPASIYNLLIVILYFSR